jgi:hypothetical protein
MSSRYVKRKLSVLVMLLGRRPKTPPHPIFPEGGVRRGDNVMEIGKAGIESGEFI